MSFRQKMKRLTNRKFGGPNVVIAIVVLLAIPVAATAADLMTTEDHDYAVQSDEAVPRSVANGAAAIDGRGRSWGMRSFTNERGERCADAGRLIDGTPAAKVAKDPSVKGAEEWTPIAPGQAGVCVADSDAPVIGSQMFPVESGGVSIVFGVAPSSVSSVSVSLNGESATVAPLANGTFIAVLDETPFVETKTAQDSLDQLDAIGRNPEKRISVSVNFVDGSSLSLRDKKVTSDADALADESLAYAMGETLDKK